MLTERDPSWQHIFSLTGDEWACDVSFTPLRSLRLIMRGLSQILKDELHFISRILQDMMGRILWRPINFSATVGLQSASNSPCQPWDSFANWS